MTDVAVNVAMNNSRTAVTKNGKGTDDRGGVLVVLGVAFTGRDCSGGGGGGVELDIVVDKDDGDGSCCQVLTLPTA